MTQKLLDRSDVIPVFEDGIQLCTMVVAVNQAFLKNRFLSCLCKRGRAGK